MAECESRWELYGGPEDYLKGKRCSLPAGHPPPCVITVPTRCPAMIDPYEGDPFTCCLAVGHAGPHLLDRAEVLGRPPRFVPFPGGMTYERR